MNKNNLLKQVRYTLYAAILLCLSGAQRLNAQDTIVNAYAKVLEIDSCWIRVDTSQGFLAEDYVLFHQAKGARIITANASNYGELVDFRGAGMFEENQIQFISNDTIYLYRQVKQPFNVDFSVQLVGIRPMRKFRSPRRITARAWDSCKGGIVYLKALDSITLKHSIDVSGKGYHGGKVSKTKVSCNNDDFRCDYQSGFGGEKGESFVKLTSNTACRGASGNGGGGGNSSNTGGGGGANGGFGGLGGKEVSFGSGACSNPRVGGVGGIGIKYDTIGLATPINHINRIFFGGGGGGGQQNNEQSDGVGGVAGMPGGGIVFINTPSLFNKKITIRTNGKSVRDTAGRDGAGGGGAGGTVAIHASNINGDLDIIANGGNGGSVDNNGFNSFCHGPGGGGGGGVLWLKALTQPSNITFTANNGNAGINVNTTSNCYLQTHGAVDGTKGHVLFDMNLNLPGAPRAFCPLHLPIATNDSFSLKEGSSKGFNIIENDTSQVAYTVKLITNPKLGNIQKANKDSIVYSSGNKGYGYDSIYYVICRKFSPLYCDTGLIVVKVLKNNFFIDLNNDTVQVKEGDPVDIDMLENDSIKGRYVLKLKYGGSNQVSFNADSSKVNFSPTGRFYGKDSIPYCACLIDKPTICDTAWIFIHVAIDTTPPLANVDFVSMYVRSNARILPFSNDNYKRGITYSIITGSSDVSSSFNTDSSLSFSWPSASPGTTSIVYEICYSDTPYTCDTAIVFIKAIVDPNRPYCKRDVYQSFPNSTIETKPLNNDAINSNIEVSILKGPLEGSIVVQSQNSINYTSSSSFIGLDSFHYMVKMTDSSFQTDSAWVVIDIKKENLKPIAVDDYYSIPRNQDLKFDPLENDSDADGNTITFSSIISPFRNGLVENQTAEWKYTANTGYFGKDSAHYEICDDGIPEKCDSAWIYITINDLPAIKIPNGFSPNNDNVNDVFEIENALFYQDLELVIYNRWGQILYTSLPYLNNWNGSDNNDKPLVDGTYFYLVRIPGSNFEQKGYVVINR